MPVRRAPEPLPVGTVVRVRNSGYGPARVVEYRGALGPGGANVYRVRDAKNAYVEVVEDQLDVGAAPQESAIRTPAAG